MMTMVASGSYRFRHALIAEAAYATLLPGEREDVHARLARALASDGARAGELAEHWIAARRPAEALTALLEAAREAQAVAGLSEALRHLERVLDLWDHVPHAEEVAGVAISTLPTWASELVGKGGADSAVPLAVSEARELYPLVVVLETMAIRRAPAFEPDALDALRETNRRMRAAAGDASAAGLADADFHARAYVSLARVEAPTAEPLPPVAIGAGPRRLELRGRVSTILWATGYRRTYPWLDEPVLDASGELVHRQGVTAVPGLFALRLRFQQTRRRTSSAASATTRR